MTNKYYPMKFSNLYVTLLIVLGMAGIACKQSENLSPIVETVDTLRIMSYNIRGDQPVDGVNQWNYRKERVADLIKKSNPALLGLQEAKPFQLQYLLTELTDYETIGGGDKAGEHTVILYNKNYVELIEGSDTTIWLSETGEKSSKGWDASHIRVLVCGLFRDIETSRHLFFLNTHFDHKGSLAREESAKLAVSTISEYSDTNPVILVGDFNLTEDELPYYTLTSNESGLENAYYTSLSPHMGPTTRSSGFSVADHSSGKPVDFVLVNDSIDVLSHAFLTDQKGGYYPSDHLPVLVEIERK